MAAARRRSPWPDLQPELLGLVLQRLPSVADRVRLRAVCRQWRRNALLEGPLLPPRLPWLALLDGTFLGISDGETHCVPLPDADADGDYFCHGSVGDDWLFFHNRTSGRRLVINPFSTADMYLPKLVTGWWREQPWSFVFFKMVLLSSSSSKGLSRNSVSAVLITDCNDDSVISICRPPSANAFRAPRREYSSIFDIAFHDGNLYALSRTKLFLLELVDSLGTGKPRVASMEPVIDYIDDDPETALRSFSKRQYTCAYWSYPVESRGRLLHVRRLVGVSPTTLSGDDHREVMERTRTFAFEVFEADLARACWRKVNDLGGGQALFVGPSSRSLPAFECGAREDCIYFICDYDRASRHADPFRDSGVFDMRDGTITPLLPPETAAVVRPTRGVVSKARPAWFFPAQAL
ncbi:hypothetical protein EJB05_46055, partial [Eragrostis curvula]